MALKTTRCILIISFIVTLLTSLTAVENVHALESRQLDDELPLLNAFVTQVRNGQADEIRGIYIPGILAARVVQQPTNDPEFVSPRQDVLTQFGLASRFGTIGLLAHNYLAGQNFPRLKENQKFYLVYGDGQVSAFVVTEILHYKAVEPASTTSKFSGLENDDLMTATELFSKVYIRQGDVVLQTCIAADENLSWGRLFVIAEPYSP
jgi:hypothetical protein